MRADWIPVYRPDLSGRERDYLCDAFDSTWISSKGEYLGRFEEAFNEYVGTSHATAVCNGTVALHLALAALSLGPGDEILVPSFTYVASVNAIRYVGATPVFVDSERSTWCLDPASLKAKVTERTKAILVVHLYGHPAPMDVLMPFAREHGLRVIEDCAEAIGATVSGQHVGTFGHIATFSFFGNKTITTGEGGMVVSCDSSLFERVVHLKGQGLARDRTYWHDVVGFNFRMTNLCAAIGLAQLERVRELVEAKKRIAAAYREICRDERVVFHDAAATQYGHSHWMVSVLLPEGKRDAIGERMANRGVETRPAFYPVHTMPMYGGRNGEYPVAEELARRGLNLPSWPGLTEHDLRRVCAELQTALADDN
jgi:perosamine synthetase